MPDRKESRQDETEPRPGEPFLHHDFSEDDLRDMFWPVALVLFSFAIVIIWYLLWRIIWSAS